MYHFLKQTLTIFLIFAFLSACAKSSKDIVGTYVSPLQYADYECPQIKSEMIRVSSKVKALTGKIDTNNENDKMITGAGLILFWPALFFLGGTKEQEAEYSRLKGEYEALDRVAVQKNCIVYWHNHYIDQIHIYQYGYFLTMIYLDYLPMNKSEKSYLVILINTTLTFS